MFEFLRHHRKISENERKRKCRKLYKYFTIRFYNTQKYGLLIEQSVIWLGKDILYRFVSTCRESIRSLTFCDTIINRERTIVWLCDNEYDDWTATDLLFKQWTPSLFVNTEGEEGDCLKCCIIYYVFDNETMRNIHQTICYNYAKYKSCCI